MTKNNEFHGYSMFNDDANVQRRAFNRVITARNIFESHGNVLCERYLQGFTEQEKSEIMVMSIAIKAKGLEEVKRQIHFEG